MATLLSLRFASLAFLFITIGAGGAAAQERPPVIDVHLHAYTQAQWNAGRPNPAGGEPAPAAAAEHMRQTLAAMDRYNIVAAVASGPLGRGVAPGGARPWNRPTS